ncbi:unnamed protein product [Miscanthus lutarioriparius]|uniref:Uncharacterized protein n=1 Tax=Miscanthus lutarioriparius TaxID=422564 RepID=A0A811Q830_9POAL|nr:unnamed protein product [Miscanthus lutarioriparius]
MSENWTKCDSNAECVKAWNFFIAYQEQNALYKLHLQRCSACGYYWQMTDIKHYSACGSTGEERNEKSNCTGSRAGSVAPASAPETLELCTPDEPKAGDLHLSEAFSISTCISVGLHRLNCMASRAFDDLDVHVPRASHVHAPPQATGVPALQEHSPRTSGVHADLASDVEAILDDVLADVASGASYEHAPLVSNANIHEMHRFRSKNKASRYKHHI